MTLNSERHALQEKISQLMWGSTVDGIDLAAIINQTQPSYDELVSLLLMINNAVGRDEVNEARYRIECFLEDQIQLYFSLKKP